MRPRGDGALVGWFDCDPRAEPEVSEWLAREHFPERLAVPGFRRGRRWRSDTGHPRYFILYETDDIGTLSSPPYLERLNSPTPWSARISSVLIDMKRSACRISLSLGDVEGGCVGTFELSPGTDSADRLRSWLGADVFPALVACAGICAVHLLEPDYETSSIETVEKSFRTAPDAMAAWIVVVEAHQPEDVWRQVARWLPAEALRSRGAEAVTPLNVYTLSFALG